MDSGGAPEGIGRSHSCHEGADFSDDARPAHRGPAGELGPVLAETAPLPPQNRVGSNHHEGVPPLGPEPGQPDPEEPISRA